MPKFQTQPWSIQANSETKWHQETHHVRKTIRSSSSSLSVKLCLQRSTWLATTSCLGGRIQLDYESNLQNSATIWLCKWQNIATTNMILMLYGDNQCAPSTWLVFVYFQFVLAKLAQSFCELGDLAFQTFLNYWHFQLFEANVGYGSKWLIAGFNKLSCHGRYWPCPSGLASWSILLATFGPNYMGIWIYIQIDCPTFLLWSVSPTLGVETNAKCGSHASTPHHFSMALHFEFLLLILTRALNQDDQWLEKRSDSKFGLLLRNGASYILTQYDGLRYLDYVWLHYDSNKWIAVYISIKWVCQTTHRKQPTLSCKVWKWSSSCLVCINLNKWMKVQKAIPGDPAGPTSSKVAPQRTASVRASSRIFKNSRLSSWVPELRLLAHAAIFHWNSWFSMYIDVLTKRPFQYQGRSGT